MPGERAGRGDRLDPRLLRRLTRPMREPGLLLRTVEARRIFGMLEWLRARLPLLAELMARRGNKAGFDGGVLIVHAHPAAGETVVVPAATAPRERVVVKAVPVPRDRVIERRERVVEKKSQLKTTVTERVRTPVEGPALTHLETQSQSVQHLNTVEHTGEHRKEHTSEHSKEHSSESNNTRVTVRETVRTVEAPAPASDAQAPVETPRVQPTVTPQPPPEVVHAQPLPSVTSAEILATLPPPLRASPGVPTIVLPAGRSRTAPMVRPREPAAPPVEMKHAPVLSDQNARFEVRSLDAPAPVQSAPTPTTEPVLPRVKARRVRPEVESNVVHQVVRAGRPESTTLPPPVRPSQAAPTVEASAARPSVRPTPSRKTRPEQSPQTAPLVHAASGASAPGAAGESSSAPDGTVSLSAAPTGNATSQPSRSKAAAPSEPPQIVVPRINIDELANKVRQKLIHHASQDRTRRGIRR